MSQFLEIVCLLRFASSPPPIDLSGPKAPDAVGYPGSNYARFAVGTDSLFVSLRTHGRPRREDYNLRRAAGRLRGNPAAPSGNAMGSSWNAPPTRRRGYPEPPAR